MDIKSLSVKKRIMPMPSEWPANHPDRNLLVNVEKYLYPSKCPSDFPKRSFIIKIPGRQARYKHEEPAGGTA